MRTLTLAFIPALLAGPAFSQQTSDRVTVSPTLPSQAASAQSKGVPASAVAALEQGMQVLAADGQAAGEVLEVIRTPDGQVNRVLIGASDGKHRSVPGANIRFADGKATLTLSRAQLLALPVLQP